MRKFKITQDCIAKKMISYPSYTDTYGIIRKSFKKGDILQYEKTQLIDYSFYVIAKDSSGDYFLFNPFEGEIY